MEGSASQANIQIVTRPIAKDEAFRIGKEWYDELVKGVADIERNIIALGGEYHMDANTLLIQNGSAQENVWGFNIYPDRTGDDWIEFVSLINIRPAAGNRSMHVEDAVIQDKMRSVIEHLIV